MGMTVVFDKLHDSQLLINEVTVFRTQNIKRGSMKDTSNALEDNEIFRSYKL